MRRRTTVFASFLLGGTLLAVGSGVAVAAPDGTYPYDTAPVATTSTAPGDAYAEHLAALAAIPIIPCDRNGPTGGDASVSAALQGQLSGRMRNGVNPGQAACARMVVQTVKDRGLNQRAATIAITTVIVEASLNDYDGGDGSSVGLFQQIQSWGSRENRLNPTWATNAFLDRMLALYPDGGWNSAPIGEVCQNVQRSAFPDRYQPEAADAAKIVEALHIFDSAGTAATATPATVYEPSTGTTEIFARGNDGKLIHVYNSGGGWSDWSVIGDWRITGNPSAVYEPSTGTTEVFARGTDGKLIHVYNTGSGWSSWYVIGDWQLAA